jgi:hypothetical protein
MDVKGDTHHNEALKGSGDVTPDIQQLESFDYDKHAEKKLIRRIDVRLLPILGCLYAIAAVDRVNVGASLAQLRRH